MYGLVSIVMPSYNTARFIKNSIDSVLAQTYKNWELLIVDDCSTDNTNEIVAQFNDSRITYVKNEKNCGAAVSRNRALAQAKGKWVAFLDSDDLWAPEKLEKQLKFMVENDYAFSYTRYEEIDENGKPTGTLVGGPRRINKTGMFNYCWPGCLTVMYNREIVGDIQIADIRKNNDYAIWLKACRKADCYLLPEKLASYRKRGGSISHGRHSEAQPKNPVTKFTRFLTLIKWHYKLYREAECLNPISSLWITARNLFFGVWKKFRYVERFA